MDEKVRPLEEYLYAGDPSQKENPETKIIDLANPTGRKTEKTDANASQTTEETPSDETSEEESGEESGEESEETKRKKKHKKAKTPVGPSQMPIVVGGVNATAEFDMPIDAGIESLFLALSDPQIANTPVGQFLDRNKEQTMHLFILQKVIGDKVRALVRNETEFCYIEKKQKEKEKEKDPLCVIFASDIATRRIDQALRMLQVLPEVCGNLRLTPASKEEPKQEEPKGPLRPTSGEKEQEEEDTEKKIGWILSDGHKEQKIIPRSHAQIMAWNILEGNEDSENLQGPVFGNPNPVSVKEPQRKQKVQHPIKEWREIIRAKIKAQSAQNKK